MPQHQPIWRFEPLVQVAHAVKPNRYETFCGKSVGGQWDGKHYRAHELNLQQKCGDCRTKTGK